jgi:hypothetical protein
VGALLLWVGATIAVPVGAASDDTAAPPGVFRSTASAQVASVEADREALLPIDDLFRFIALDTSSTYETDLQTARASLMFPGNGFIMGPALACGTFGGQFPAEFKPILDTCLRYDYPLSVRADASSPDRAATGTLALGAPTDAVSADAVAARAHAAADGASGFAAMNDLRVLGLPAFGPIPLPLDQLNLDTSVLTIDSAVSKTEQSVIKGVLTIRAESVLSGVKLVGGLIRIGSLHSVSLVTDDAAGTPVTHADLQVSGVTVAGQPAKLTKDGIVVGDPANGSGPIQQQTQTALNQVLQGLGVRVSVLDATENPDDHGQAVAAVGGLLVEMAATADGLPTLPGPQGDVDLNGRYVGSIQLGNTAAAGRAFSFDDATLVDETLSTDVGSGTLAGGGDAGSTVPSGSAVDTGSSFVAPGRAVVSPTAAAGAPVPRAATGGDPRPQLVGRVTDTFGGRMGWLYLVFSGAVLLLCLLPGLVIPARLPGRRS